MCGAPKGVLGERQKSAIAWKRMQQEDEMKEGVGTHAGRGDTAASASGGTDGSGSLSGDRAVGSYSPPAVSIGSVGGRHEDDEGQQSFTDQKHSQNLT